MIAKSHKQAKRWTFLKDLFTNLFKSSKKNLPEHQKLGRWGEDVSANLLKSKGYKILGKRVRIGKKDELDIVARKDQTLIFVEVKTRNSEIFSRPVSAVNRKKKSYLSRAAVRYLKKLEKPPPYIRFDVIEVIGTLKESHPVVRHLESVFILDKKYNIWW